MRLRKDIVIPCSIYLFTLAIVLVYALFKQVLASDQMLEYQVYQLYLHQDSWQFVIDNLLNSCPINTLLPAYLQQATGWNELILFKVYPTFFYALIPIGTYLLSRRYLGIWQSVLCACVVIASFNIIYYPALGRVNIAIAFLVLSVYAVVSEKWILAFICMGCLVFSHYGTAVAGIGVICAYMIGTALYYRRKRQIVILLCVVVAVVGIGYTWHFHIAKTSGQYITAFIQDAIEDMNPGNSNMFDLEEKDGVTQAAFRPNMAYRNLLSKVRWLVSWLLAGGFVLGHLYNLKTRRLPFGMVVIGGSMLTFILLSVLINEISTSYGTGRVYYTSVPLLAPFYGLLATKGKYSTIACSGIVALHAYTMSWLVNV